MALSPEEIKALKEAKKERKQKAAEPEVVLDRSNPVVEKKELFQHVVEAHKNQDPSNIVDKKTKEKTDELLEMAHQEAIIHTIQHDEGVQKKVVKGAEEHVLTELEIRKQVQTKKVQDATFDAIEDAAQNYGIDSGRPLWQLRMAQVGSSFWFIVWFIISSFTFTPVLFFLKMIGTQIENAKLKWTFTVLLYLMLIFGLFMWISKLSGWTWWEPSATIVTE